MADLEVADLAVVEGRTPVRERLREAVEVAEELDVLAAQADIVVLILDFLTVGLQ